MKDNTLVWVGIILTLIAGWTQIYNFINSFLEGFIDVANAFPPILILGIIIWIIYALGNKK